MTTPDLKALSDAATQGKWADLRELHFNSDKRFASALVNAHRAGQLFTAADVEVAVLAEREACLADVGLAPMVEGRDGIRKRIRARTTQEGET